MHNVTTCLVEVLGTRIDQQRLDSTHVFSDMYQVGRTRLLGVALKRFLTQVQRHDPAAYASLPEALRQRYTPSEHQLFGDVAKDRESRRLLRQQVAEDLYQVLRRFADQPAHAEPPQLSGDGADLLASNARSRKKRSSSKTRPAAR